MLPSRPKEPQEERSKVLMAVDAIRILLNFIKVYDKLFLTPIKSIILFTFSEPHEANQTVKSPDPH